MKQRVSRKSTVNHTEKKISGLHGAGNSCYFFDTLQPNKLPCSDNEEVRKAIEFKSKHNI